MDVNDSLPEINDDLITDLKNYGPNAKGWLFNFGNFDLAVGYTLIFWPSFTVIENYVLRHGSTKKNLLEFLKATNGNSIATQAVMNHVHISDLHFKNINEAQARYLGRTLRAIYQAKLRVDFPDRTFVVKFNDEPGLDPLDYELTFWQVCGSETG